MGPTPALPALGDGIQGQQEPDEVCKDCRKGYAETGQGAVRAQPVCIDSAAEETIWDWLDDVYLDGPSSAQTIERAPFW